MTKADATCVVCGASPTVKMHVFPRAMMFRIRGTEKHLVAGDRHRKGVRFRQSGLWDDQIVCERHERMFAGADDYAIDLCRRIELDSRPTSSGNAFEISNPAPDLLIRFACATVWRQVVSREGRGSGLDLGPYRQSFESYLFSGGDVPTQIMLGRTNLTNPDGRPLELEIAPYQQRMLGCSVWHFTMGPLDVFLKTDKRFFPASWTPYLANNNDPLTLIAMDARRVDQVPILRPILQIMFHR